MKKKVQLFCFDKTGTLTKEGLEFYGTQSVKNTDKPTFESHVLENESTPRLMQIGLATCHAVTVLNDQFIGNPVDIEMFRSSKWKLAEKSDYVDTVTPPMTQPGVSTAPVHIIKRFEFVHARMSMSVAVLDTLENKVHVFVKGAYEKIKDISNPESIPHDYDVTAANLAKQGCYVMSK